MGAEHSSQQSDHQSAGVSECSSGFPNNIKENEEIQSWSLLHHCNIAQWKQGHAEEAGFREKTLVCSNTLHKDCGPAFCISRRGLISVNRSLSVFSFRRRSKFTKMAEHFEYNHIPAHVSSIQNFHVQSVVCCENSLAVLHLVKNRCSQFGLIDMERKKFLGVFGQQLCEVSSEVLRGQISPDRRRCIIKLPVKRERELRAPSVTYVMFLYEFREREKKPFGGGKSAWGKGAVAAKVSSVGSSSSSSASAAIPSTSTSTLKTSAFIAKNKTYNIELAGQFELPSAHTEFCFDPRCGSTSSAVSGALGTEVSFGGGSESPRSTSGSTAGEGIRIAATDILDETPNSLSIVDVTNGWTPLATNYDANDTHHTLHPYLRYLAYTRDGSAIVASVVSNSCHCRVRKYRRQPVQSCIYVYSSETAETTHCIQYSRYTCAQHLCPINHQPVFSRCGTRMAVVMNWAGKPSEDYVQVYQLPPVLNLQSVCRAVILQCTMNNRIHELPIPTKLVDYLRFMPS